MMEDNLIQRLMTTVKCGGCGQHYEAGGITVLGHQENLWFLSALCRACHVRYLVAVVVKEDRVTEVVTDLTESELARLNTSGMPAEDELLDMHNFLKDFDGDFSRLFSQE